MVKKKYIGRERTRRYKMEKFDVVIYLALIFVGLICLFPLMYVFSVSLTPITEVYENGGFVLIPKEITFDAYYSILTSSGIPRALQVTVAISTVGTLFSVFLTILAAYPLSRKDLPGRKFLVQFFVFTMLFSGGTIPTYLVVKALGLTGSYLSLIIPTAISTYNMLVMKAFYESLPLELSEAARIDGMNEYQIWAKIMLPLSKPALSTLTIFTFVNTWNDFLGPLIYLKTEAKKTLQLGLKMFLSQYSSEYGLIMAASVLSLIPVLIVFLALQQYFVEGIAATGVKG